MERKDQENRTMQKYLEKLFEEDADKLERKRAEQIGLREDLHKCNADIIRRKLLAKEQEKMIEQKVSGGSVFLKLWCCVGKKEGSFV